MIRQTTTGILILLLALLATVAGAQSAEDAYDLEEPQGAFAWIKVPETVKVGQTFTLNVEILNLRPKAFKLKDIDISHTWLAGFELVGVAPKPKEVVDFAPEYESLVLERSILPGDRLSVSVNLRATQPGIYSGDVDIWENVEELYFFTRRAQTRVTR